MGVSIFQISFSAESDTSGSQSIIFLVEATSALLSEVLAMRAPAKASIR